MSLFEELQQRRVPRALIAYGIVAFALLQIIEPVMHGLHWPDAVLGYVVVALGAGFPLVVAFAWAFDVKAGRIERTARPPAPTAPRGSRLFLLLLGVGLAAAAPGVVWYFLLRERPPPAAVPARPPPSVAVLPFRNLSGDPAQEYLSDGIAEEILNALAQVDGLRVSGRISSFSFKGQDADAAVIAARLRVGTLLEGSVRTSGRRVRIAAQLVNAADGYHLWSGQFDRELTDVFKVQEEIAAAVVQALRLKLLPPSGPPESGRRPKDPEAYRLFLLGRSLEKLATQDGERRATIALQRAVALEPTYAPAWQWLALTTGSAALNTWQADSEALARQAEDAVDHAIQADPQSAEGYAVRGWIRAGLRWDWAGAQVDLERAMAMTRTEVVLQTWATLVQKLGRLKEAIAAQSQVTDIDPLNVYAWVNLGGFLEEDGQLPAAREAFRQALELSPGTSLPASDLATLDLLEGHAAKALEGFEKLPAARDRLLGVALCRFSLAQEKESRQALEELAASPSTQMAYRLATAHAWRGERDQAFLWLDRAYAVHDLGLRAVKVDPLLRNLHGDPRFAALLRKMKLPVD